MWYIYIHNFENQKQVYGEKVAMSFTFLSSPPYRYIFYIYVSLYNNNFGCFPAVYAYIAKYAFTTFFHSLI